MTITDLILPKRGIAALELPSYIKFDGAFALGEGAVLGDKSRYRSHGTISGADWATGLHGKCLEFVAASKDYVEIPASHTQLNFTSEDFSGIVRIKIDDATIQKALFLRGSHNVDGWWFYIDPNGRLIFRTSQSGASQVTQTTVAITSTIVWYTVGFSRKGTTAKTYVNGVENVEAGASHTNPATCARSAKIGIRNDLSTGAFDGKMEFLRIFGGIALSASEHLAYHNALA